MRVQLRGLAEKLQVPQIYGVRGTEPKGYDVHDTEPKSFQLKCFWIGKKKKIIYIDHLSNHSLSLVCVQIPGAIVRCASYAPTSRPAHPINRFLFARVYSLGLYLSRLLRHAL